MKDYCFVYNNKVWIKLKFNDILNIVADGDYVKIYTLSKKHHIHFPLSAILLRLPESFLRCHHSHVVNLDQIDRFEGSILWIGEKQIPISQKYKNSFLEKINCLIHKKSK